MEVSGIKKSLKREADVISASRTVLPLPIGRICYEQGMQIARRADVNAFKALMLLPRSPSDWARVFLPKTSSTSSKATSHERFCLAHELGHLIIYKRFNIIPDGKRQYWEHELICDYFARNLLLPDRFLPPDVDVSHFGERVYALSRMARIPTMQVAKRLTERHCKFVFLRVVSSGGRFCILSLSIDFPRMVKKDISGILHIKILKMFQTGENKKTFFLSGLTLIDSGLINLHPSREYCVGVYRGHLENEILVCATEVEKDKEKY